LRGKSPAFLGLDALGALGLLGGLGFLGALGLLGGLGLLGASGWALTYFIQEKKEEKQEKLTILIKFAINWYRLQLLTLIS